MAGRSTEETGGGRDEQGGGGMVARIEEARKLIKRRVKQMSHRQRRERAQRRAQSIIDNQITHPRKFWSCFSHFKFNKPSLLTVTETLQNGQTVLRTEGQAVRRAVSAI